MAAKLPARPTYKTSAYVTIGMTVAPGEEFQLPPFIFFDCAKYKNAKHPELVFTTWLHVYGRLRYYDHFNRERPHGFVAQWIPPKVAGPQPEGEHFIWMKKRALELRQIARLAICCIALITPVKSRMSQKGSALCGRP